MSSEVLRTSATWFIIHKNHVFVKHFYACASLIGAFACVALHRTVGDTVAMMIGAVLIVLLRFLAAHFRWELPKASDR